MKKIVIILLFLASLGTVSQTKKALRKVRPNYLVFGFGPNYSTFRDFATSPLIYKGTPLSYALSRIKFDKKRASEFGVVYAVGNYSNRFNNHEAVSTVKVISLYYSQLYQLNRLSSDNLNVKVGGLYNTMINLRVNEYLRNNGVGIEMIGTLFGSIKATKYIGKSNKSKRRKNIGFRLNVGLMNSTVRNNYAYTLHTSVLNNSEYFNDYQFKAFSGFRMSSALDFMIPLNNKNIIQISYLWDAYKTGGDLDKFEMAYHSIRFNFLFNLNNR